MSKQLELALQSNTMDHDSNSSTSKTETIYDKPDPNNSWISAFNTSLLTTRATATTDQSQEIGRLMGTPEFASLLVAAQHLSKTQNLSEEESTERLIELFRAIDHAWRQVVMSRGLNSLIGKE